MEEPEAKRPKSLEEENTSCLPSCITCGWLTNRPLKGEVNLTFSY